MRALPVPAPLARVPSASQPQLVLLAAELGQLHVAPAAFLVPSARLGQSFLAPPVLAAVAVQLRLL